MHVKWKLLTHLTEVIKAVVNIKMANTKTMYCYEVFTDNFDYTYVTYIVIIKSITRCVIKR